MVVIVVVSTFVEYVKVEEQVIVEREKIDVVDGVVGMVVPDVVVAAVVAVVSLVAVLWQRG